MVNTTHTQEAEDSAASSSDYSLLGEFSHPLPTEIVISTILWLVCIFAVVGNILVFFVILRDKQLRSNVGNIYILNLASADFCVGINSLTLNNIWRYYGNWPFGRALCVAWTILDYSACMQAGFAVTLISLDRYFMVTKYLEYRKFESKARAAILTAATWAVSLLFYAVPILGDGLWPGAKAYGTVNYSVTCDFGVLYILAYNIAQIIAGFVVPATMLVYLNFKVYSNILKRSKGLVRTAPTVPSQRSAIGEAGASDPAVLHSVSAESTAVTGESVQDSRKTYKKHRKAAITLAIIVGTFSLSWVPYYIMQFLFVVDKIKFSWLLWNSVYYTVWANSAINPFIYAATSPRIRHGLLAVLCFWNGRLPRRNRPM